MKSRQLLNENFNPGLVQLSGAFGAGISQAGNQIANLGTTINTQDMYDAEKIAAEKEKVAMQDALRAKNYVFNPAAVARINQQYGTNDSTVSDINAPSMANATLGRVDLGAPKAPAYKAVGKSLVNLDTGKAIYTEPTEAKAPKVTKTIVDNADNVHLVFDDGTTKPTGIKSKEWNVPTKKSEMPSNFDRYSPTSANDSETYDLAVMGAFQNDKHGDIFVDKNKLENYRKLGATQKN